MSGGRAECNSGGLQQQQSVSFNRLVLRLLTRACCCETVLFAALKASLGGALSANDALLAQCAPPPTTTADPCRPRPARRPLPMRASSSWSTAEGAGDGGGEHQCCNVVDLCLILLAAW